MADLLEIAHRGFAGRYPENTLAAVAAAARDGVDLVEVDVVPCADGTPVAFHDHRLDGAEGERGITDAAGVVWETDRETVLTAEVLDSGETVPRLADVVETLKAAPGDVGVNVELKHPGVPEVSVMPTGSEADRDARRRRWLPFVERVLGTLEGFDGEVLVSSFDAAALAAVREVDPDASLAVLFADDPGGALDDATRLDAVALHPPTDAVLHGSETPPDAPDLVALAHEEDLDVNVWTVETWHEAHRLRRAGVDGVIADYPGLPDGW